MASCKTLKHWDGWRLIVVVVVALVVIAVAPTLVIYRLATAFDPGYPTTTNDFRVVIRNDRGDVLTVYAESSWPFEFPGAQATTRSLDLFPGDRSNDSQPMIHRIPAGESRAIHGIPASRERGDFGGVAIFLVADDHWPLNTEPTAAGASTAPVRIYGGQWEIIASEADAGELHVRMESLHAESLREN